MARDKYNAVWVSHSSISDFLHCPRAYYLKNVYKDKNTGNKMKVMAPALALGGAVHEVLEGLTVLPKDTRFSESLITKFQAVWTKYGGKQGGFLNQDTEYAFRQRGEAMLRRVYNNPGPLKDLSIKIKQDLPYYWLSEEDNIILCGKVDWLEYLADSDTVHIIDFKTGKRKEEAGSLQLPIYLLLVQNTQTKIVSRASYWYLETDDRLTVQDLPEVAEAEKKVLDIARKIKLARKLEKYDCPKGKGGCFACQPMERILKGEGELVGNDQYGSDVYILPEVNESDKPESEIL